MKREDIEKAAGEYSGSVLGFKDNPVVMAKHKAFTAGAEWHFDSLMICCGSGKTRSGVRLYGLNKK